MKGKSGRKAATIEAREEAGVLGKTLKAPAGSFSYWKRLEHNFVRVDVVVYLLEVSEELANWQEAKRRQRAWLAPAGRGDAHRRARSFDAGGDLGDRPAGPPDPA